MPGNDLFLDKIQPVRPEMLSVGATDDERRVPTEHFEYLEGLTRAGTVLLAGRTLNTDPSSFGIVLLRAESEEAAREIMLNDPAVRQRSCEPSSFPIASPCWGTSEVRTWGLRCNPSFGSPICSRSGRVSFVRMFAPGGPWIRRRGG
jgi:uncharacterized protein